MNLIKPARICSLRCKRRPRHSAESRDEPGELQVGPKQSHTLLCHTLPKCPDSPGVKIQSVCPQPGRGVLLSTSKRTPLFIQDIPPVNYFFWALNV